MSRRFGLAVSKENPSAPAPTPEKNQAIQYYAAALASCLAKSFQDIMGTALTAKCKKCGMGFQDKERLERHKKVHGRKSKASEATSIKQDSSDSWLRAGKHRYSERRQEIRAFDRQRRFHLREINKHQ